MRLRIRIDRLVLHSVSELDVMRFRGAFAAELARLIREEGLPVRGEPARNSTAYVLPAPSPHASADDVGRTCAQHVYGTLV